MFDRVIPLTLAELEEPLTPDERKEMENPSYLHQLNLYIEAVNSIPNLGNTRRNNIAEQLR